MNQTVNHANAPEPIGPYSQAVYVNKALATDVSTQQGTPTLPYYVCGGELYTSGQIGIVPETKLLLSGLENQTRQVFKNIGAILERVGMTFDDVVKTTCYLVDSKDFDIFNKIYAEFFEQSPARSCIFVAGLPKNALVEVEVISKYSAHLSLELLDLPDPL
jgi:2-iminobutanoate/2-iminopropanoate deaminase